MQPFQIGLTGGIGTGKSTAAALLAQLGADVVSGDELGRQALESSAGLRDEIRQRFSDEVFDSNGRILRRELGQRVFTSPDHARWLTQATFPEIHRLWREAVAHTGKRVIVLDAALIFEWGIENEFDLVLVVAADPDIAVRRMTADGRLSRAEVRARALNQLDPSHKERKAAVVLRNEGSLPAFRQKILSFWNTHVQPALLKDRKDEHDRS
jgi:dephospho-CoA kinase